MYRNQMLVNRNNFLKQKNISIFIFIQKITPKNMQDLIFFLQKNDFSLKRITKKNKQQNLTSIFVNSNFILESQQNIRRDQLKILLLFLHKHSQINGLTFNNQIFNFERSSQFFENQSLLILWKQINNFIF